ncbi:hypothetical protein DPMN_039313 [Dreissena polymorpha]|uniref:Uncharacterized protein n=1 Tax=Dreissena polymorpha TaxID=45954 RepID=A0A9D4MFR6_DREPO|nr:hypothetical protein DPMN_039313 [Dreissena polymorpha]
MPDGHKDGRKEGRKDNATISLRLAQRKINMKNGSDTTTVNITVVQYCGAHATIKIAFVSVSVHAFTIFQTHHEGSLGQTVRDYCWLSCNKILQKLIYFVRS